MPGFAPKPAMNSASLIPVPAPVTPAAPVKPVAENTKAALAPTAMNGIKKMVLVKNPKSNGASATAWPKTATSATFFTATEPAALKKFPAKPRLLLLSTKAPTVIVDKLWR